MKSSLIREKAFVAVVVFSISLTSASASHAAINIHLGITDNVGFDLGSTNNDKLNPLQVNIDQLFGFDDWTFAEKAFDLDEDIDIGLVATQTSSGENKAGDWLINDVWGTYENVMLVLKGGNADPGVYVGYLLKNGDTSGNYQSPFTNSSTNLNVKEISHMSAYFRGTAIPEPGSLAMLSSVLVGQLVRRRRRAVPGCPEK